MSHVPAIFVKRVKNVLLNIGGFSIMVDTMCFYPPKLVFGTS
jgi:hypothetical protein